MYNHRHDTIVNNDNEKTIMRKFIQYDSVFMELQLLYAGNGRVRVLFCNPQDTDNGPGIPTMQRAALFNNEADIGIKNGLGLPLVRDFATAVNCAIQVSTAQTGGAIFTRLFRE
jgi:signal transduction histidine kinase